ncbi:putative E3 ubiquitin-protein ligase dtx2 [Chamberlinius hualienensis]
MTYKTVAVWEYQSNDIDWIPYCAEVCHQLERASCNNLTKLYLGDIDASLGAYVINLGRREQLNTLTGTTRTIRRRLYTLSPGCIGYTIALGIRWLWLADKFGRWCSYPTEIQHLIESAYRKNLPEVDLESFSNRLPYSINFTTMSQVRKVTGSARSVRRATTRSYPYAKPEKTKTDSVNSDNSVTVSNENNDNEANVSTNHKPPQKLTRSLKKKTKPQTETESSSLIPTTIGSRILSWMKTSIVPLSISTSDTSSTDTLVASTSTRGKTKSRRSKTQSCISSKPKTVKNVRAVENLDVEMLLERYTFIKRNPPNEDCIICCEQLTASSSYADDDDTVLQFTKCEHMFHQPCLKAMLNCGNATSYIQCPTCKVIYGKKIGNQPEGIMKYYGFKESLPGFSDSHTICIMYEFRGGIQGSDHPNPGEPYSVSGFPRLCYLPDNEEGRKILQMLIVAWRRRLTFTVGTSITTGYNNVVTWNEIHHKTEFGSNFSGHGYPDTNYFDNVKLELASHGVMEDDSELEDL